MAQHSQSHLRGGRRGGTSCRTLRCETQVPPPSCGCFGMVALHCVQSGRTVSFHYTLHGLACALSTRRFDRLPVQTALLRRPLTTGFDFKFVPEPDNCFAGDLGTVTPEPAARRNVCRVTSSATICRLELLDKSSLQPIAHATSNDKRKREARGRVLVGAGGPTHRTGPR